MQTRLDQTPDAMRTRRKTVEHPYGTIKAWMGATHFLTRTLPKVSTEMSLHVLVYNFKRMLSILGQQALMAAMATGIMQSGFRWRRSSNRRRSPFVSRPTRRRSVALMAVVAPWHWSVASQVFQSVACGQSSPVSPRPPHRGLAATRHWPPCAGLPVCPPRGRPQSGAKARRLTAAGPKPQICGASPCTCGGIAQVWNTKQKSLLQIR